MLAIKTILLFLFLIYLASFFSLVAFFFVESNGLLENDSMAEVPHMFYNTIWSERKHIKLSPFRVDQTPNTNVSLDMSPHGSLQQDINNKCKFWKLQQRWKYSIQPRIVLDPEKFLYPGLISGPNNQFAGLKQSVYLAIRLNRTLAIPFFMSHFTSEGGEQTIPPYQIIDVDRLCRFVSCISIPDLKSKCNGAFDVALQAMAANSKDIRRFERNTGMQIIEIKNKVTPVPGAVPFQMNHKFKHIDIPALANTTSAMMWTPWLSPDSVSIQRIYKTSAACAIYTSALNGIKTSLKNDVASSLSNSMTNVTTIPDDVLYSAVTDAVRHPPCIVEAAESYVKDVLNGEEYVAVHWRYDKGDWGKMCNAKTVRISKKIICKYYSIIEPVHLAQGITSNLLAHNEKLKNKHIYIATPSSLNTFKEKTFSELKRLKNTFQKPPKKLKTYLAERYQKCRISSSAWKPQEVISMVEMEIMRLSSWFFYSNHSTWSTNVIPLRSERHCNGSIKMKYSRPILNVALTQL